jgi:hypothetical protein
MHAVFKRENHLHVDSIAFTVPQVRRSDRSEARWLSGDMVMLNNPSPALSVLNCGQCFAPPRERIGHLIGEKDLPGPMLVFSVFCDQSEA